MKREDLIDPKLVSLGSRWDSVYDNGYILFGGSWEQERGLVPRVKGLGDDNVGRVRGDGRQEGEHLSRRPHRQQRTSMRQQHRSSDVSQDHAAARDHLVQNLLVDWV